jgi:hypothetical protein
VRHTVELVVGRIYAGVQDTISAAQRRYLCQGQ